MALFRGKTFYEVFKRGSQAQNTQDSTMSQCPRKCLITPGLFDKYQTLFIGLKQHGQSDLLCILHNSTFSVDHRSGLNLCISISLN